MPKEVWETAERKMYKHCDEKEDTISLHDCRAEKAILRDGVLSFFFSDGFWINSRNACNETNQTVKTDESEVRFYLESGDKWDVTVYVFTDKGTRKAIRKEWKAKKLIRSINSGKCQLEFLYQYRGYNTRIIECCLWFDKKPYFKKCLLKISTNKVIYCWNDLCEDRIW